MAEIFVEVRPSATNGGQDLALGKSLYDRFGQRAGEISQAISDVVHQLGEKLSDDGVLGRASEIELAFGLEVQAETGIIISRAALASTLTVTVKFKCPADK